MMLGEQYNKMCTREIVIKQTEWLFSADCGKHRHKDTNPACLSSCRLASLREVQQFQSVVLHISTYQSDK